MRPKGNIRLLDGHEGWKHRKRDMINGSSIVDYNMWYGQYSVSH